MQIILKRGWNVIVITSLLFFPVSITAQSDFQEIKFENISIKDGLSQSSPNCIFQDSRGLMWIGTEDGLNRYDGYRFDTCKPDPNDVKSKLQRFWRRPSGGKKS